MAADAQQGTNWRNEVPEVTLVRVDEPGWDAVIDRTRHSVFHTAAYHRYTRGFGAGEPYLAVVGGETRGLAWPYLLRPVAGVPGVGTSEVTDVHSVYGYPGPLAWGCPADNGFVRAAIDAVAETWRAQGAVSAFTRFNPLLGNASLIPTGTRVIEPGGITQAGQTVSVDLRLDEAAVQRDYGRGLARNIRSARRAGLHTVHDVDWVYIKTFAQLYATTMARLNAAESYYFQKEDFLRLRANYVRGTHLLVTLVGDDVAAAGLFLDSGDVVEWHLVGSNDAYIQFSPSKVLADDAIRWARDRGFRTMHMGGGRGGREDSLYWFKSRFSKRRHPFAVGRWILDPGTYSELTAQRRATLPTGTRLSAAFFPAYRSPVVSDSDLAD